MKILIASILLLIAQKSFGQIKCPCDTVYVKPQKLAQFKTGNDELIHYVLDSLIPIVGNCNKENGNIIEKLSIKFTIDMDGKVIAVDFPRLDASQKCKDRLRNEALNMRNWTPGQMNGKNVCSIFFLPISCLKWE